MYELPFASVTDDLLQKALPNHKANNFAGDKNGFHEFPISQILFNDRQVCAAATASACQGFLCYILQSHVFHLPEWHKLRCLCTKRAGRPEASLDQNTVRMAQKRPNFFRQMRASGASTRVKVLLALVQACFRAALVVSIKAAMAVLKFIFPHLRQPYAKL